MYGLFLNLINLDTSCKQQHEKVTGGSVAKKKHLDLSGLTTRNIGPETRKEISKTKHTMSQGNMSLFHWMVVRTNMEVRNVSLKQAKMSVEA